MVTSVTMTNNNPPLLGFANSGLTDKADFRVLMTSGARTIKIAYEHQLTRHTIGVSGGKVDIEQFLAAEGKQVYIESLEYTLTEGGEKLAASLVDADGMPLVFADSLTINLIEKDKP